MHKRLLSWHDRVHGTGPASRVALLWPRHQCLQSLRGSRVHVIADQLDRVVLPGHVPEPVRLHAGTRLDVQRRSSDLIDPRHVLAGRYVRVLDGLWVEPGYGQMQVVMKRRRSSSGFAPDPSATSARASGSRARPGPTGVTFVIHGQVREACRESARPGGERVCRGHASVPQDTRICEPDRRVRPARRRPRQRLPCTCERFPRACPSHRRARERCERACHA
jgi:hypothetical protein